MFNLQNYQRILVKQRHEISEWIGFEGRNKYEITDEKGNLLFFAAENQKGILGFLFRQFLGHWRTFEIHLYNSERELVAVAKHPFRFFFQRLEIFNDQGMMLGALQQRFAIFSKKFDLENAMERPIMQVSSPIWKIWTFPFVQDGVEVALIEKKWSGLLSEMFTDKDNFLVTYKATHLDEKVRMVLLLAAIFIDLQYFEMKARSSID